MPIHITSPVGEIAMKGRTLREYLFKFRQLSKRRAIVNSLVDY